VPFISRIIAGKIAPAFFHAFRGYYMDFLPIGYENGDVTSPYVSE
jgi:hypothetical protein